MQASPSPWFKKFLPPKNTAGRTEQLRASLGAMAALALTALVCMELMGEAGMWLVAPMGASAVLMFCLPASPLAQPWPVIGGNILSALIGVACAKAFGAGMWTAPLAGALAIAAMFALRCLHPPGGAVALTAVLGGPAVHALGYRYALTPVAFNCLLMVGAALVFNNLTKRRYPHIEHSPLENQHATADPAPTARLGFQREDLDAVLAQYNQVLDVSRDDLENIILATEAHAYERRFGIITCGAIMSRDAVTAVFSTELGTAWRAMRRHHVHAMPVLSEGRRVIGMIAMSDFLRHSDLDDFRTLGERLRKLIERNPGAHANKPEVVGQIMTAPVQSAFVDTPIVELVPLMANSGKHHIPVLERDGRFAGIVTHADLIAALYEARLSEPLSGQAAA